MKYLFFTEPCAWEDTNIFGHPVSATNTDYKGRGYFELNVSYFSFAGLKSIIPYPWSQAEVYYRDLL